MVDCLVRRVRAIAAKGCLVGGYPTAIATDTLVCRYPEKSLDEKSLDEKGIP